MPKYPTFVEAGASGDLRCSNAYICAMKCPLRAGRLNRNPIIHDSFTEIVEGEWSGTSQAKAFQHLQDSAQTENLIHEAYRPYNKNTGERIHCNVYVENILYISAPVERRG